jgi:hypothetical protein
MSKKVAFYTDEPWKDEESNLDWHLGKKVRKKILEFLGAEEEIFVNANPTIGFSSGIDWNQLVDNNPTLVAVVLLDVTDACVHGTSIEISTSLPDNSLFLYLLDGDELLDISETNHMWESVLKLAG